jgi:steroid delta-isomerase-like uncharacterized protein
MTESHGVRALHGCIDDFNSHDPERALRAYADDLEHVVPALGQVWRGKAQQQEAYRHLYRAWPNVHVRLVTAIGTADYVAGEWILSGIAERPLGTLPATGRPFSVRGVTCARLHAGGVQRQVDYWDLATVLRQIGLLSPPAEP